MFAAAVKAGTSGGVHVHRGRMKAFVEVRRGGQGGRREVQQQTDQACSTDNAP
jgi:hypothetical protein